MSNIYYINPWPTDAHEAVEELRKSDRSDVSCLDGSDPTYIGDNLKETSYNRQSINKEIRSTEVIGETVSMNTHNTTTSSAYNSASDSASDFQPLSIQEALDYCKRHRLKYNNTGEALKIADIHRRQAAF